MGFDGFFFGRIDYDDKQFRLNTSTMEMIWRGSQSLKEGSDIFTGVLYNKYRAPDGFCYDARCTDGIPIQVSMYTCISPIFIYRYNFAIL